MQSLFYLTYRVALSLSSCWLQKSKDKVAKKVIQLKNEVDGLRFRLKHSAKETELARSKVNDCVEEIKSLKVLLRDAEYKIETTGTSAQGVDDKVLNRVFLTVCVVL